ncbi:MAG TPA: hypothetical protein VLG36_03555 [Candidatus Chromulinivoraceae bacterium]|nr:hypothetical protein [Candidatus Chromulinivoraceae bacterium]
MKKLIKNKKIAYLLLVIVIIIAGALTTIFLVNKSASQKTYPLGDQLEYIGQTGYGCWLICDSNPNAIYYYGTDLDITSVIKYFQKATVVKQPSNIDGQIYFGIKTPSGETIYTNYYINKNDVYNSNTSLKSTKKQHILEIPNFKYQVAKQSL